MILLLDIGNSHLHLGLANAHRVLRHVNLPTRPVRQARFSQELLAFAGRNTVTRAALCSVVPELTPRLRRLIRAHWAVPCFELNHRTVRHIRIDYPRPHTIGPDRLANAIAVTRLFGAPAVVIDFGTAVTFDVIDRHHTYIGGIIAPGLSAMTDYLHEKTALLPRIEIRDTRAVVGKSTEQAMRIAAVHGYRGLIRELLRRLRQKLGRRRIPVVATGGSAALVARGMPDITAVHPTLTLEGLRLALPPDLKAQI